MSHIAHQPQADIENDAVAAPAGLPFIPRSLLPNLFERLSVRDRELVLREKIIPVAWLPHFTLYGALGDHARHRAEAHGLTVVAQVAERDYRNGIHSHLADELLNNAVFGLKNSRKAFSACQRLTLIQIVWAIILLTWITCAAIYLNSEYFYAVASLIFGLFFLSVIALRLFSLINLTSQKRQTRPRLNDDVLPIYSVLVPVFRETGVLNQLIGALSRLNYPKAKLDIKIIVEENDLNMNLALAKLTLPDYFEVIVVPVGKPQTKPRALNYALQFARGELLTIYDAEDVPEPMQLRKAAEKFAATPRKLACLQAELTFYNPNENWMTRQFTVEYGILFRLILPSLAREGLPFLLGGTSNHFRISILRQIGAWDPFNVTEDADLAIRLVRHGYNISVLDSVTYEEANTELGNWLQQRSRWLKGLLQTWLVHMRNPALLIESIGLGGFWVVQTTTFAIFFSAMFHPVFVVHTLYSTWSGRLMQNEQSLWLSLLYGINLAVLISGYAVSIYAGWVTLRQLRFRNWWFTLATMPLYWLLMSVAGWLALWQFIVAPFHWNKTRHGLSALQKGRTAK